MAAFIVAGCAIALVAGATDENAIVKFGLFVAASALNAYGIHGMLAGATN